MLVMPILVDSSFQECLAHFQSWSVGHRDLDIIKETAPLEDKTCLIDIAKNKTNKHNIE